MEGKLVHKAYFIGIGGIGMSSIARYFLKNKVEIFGYDKTPSPITKSLVDEGATIYFEDNPELIPDNIDIVVYTPAIPKTNKVFINLQNKSIPFLKRAEVLGMITENEKGIAVAGTHGKTSVSTMIAYLIKQSNIDCKAFIGGISKNYNTNFLWSEKSDLVVMEADEFDRSFLYLSPDIAVITSMDADHLDIYGEKEKLVQSFAEFSEKIKPNGSIIIKKGLEKIINRKDIKLFTYSLEKGADFCADKINLVNDIYKFDFVGRNSRIENLKLGIPGIINVENAIAAIAVATLKGVTEEEIKTALESFSGVKRRFDVRIKRDDFVYIDDYAHHPEELKACIASIRDMYSGKKIVGVFQPHLFSRTRDFADEFAKSLELLDEVVLLEIYPAREKPIHGVDSQMILDKINKKEKWLCEKSELPEFIKKRNPGVLLTLGAGDIDRLVEPIETVFAK